MIENSIKLLEETLQGRNTGKQPGQVLEKTGRTGGSLPARPPCGILRHSVSRSAQPEGQQPPNLSLVKALRLWRVDKWY